MQFSVQSMTGRTITRKPVPGASRRVAAVAARPARNGPALLREGGGGREGGGRRYRTSRWAARARRGAVSPPTAFADISRLVRPNRVAVVGASDRPGSLG